MRKTTRLGVAVLAATLMTTGGAAVAAVAADPIDDSQIGIDVEVTPQEGPGSLMLTVAPGRATLTEQGSTGEARQFTGTLPQVTVTDTRSADDVAEGAQWSVLGSASDFTNADGAVIEAKYLGWSPRLVAGDENTISVGGDVDGALPSQPDSDPGRGLKDQELLYLSDAASLPEGGATSTATADLTLRVPATVAAGQYSSTITLSLFE
ncbi:MULTISPECIES: hypothetical protein [unclassified Microbacterium]|uniref:hypothetical protein n=1 Tax=unclassified Microbacterium TaxID=2609290 RepID=UPI00177D078E|nr:MULTISPECIES: hypothetical protein [unclassified Microbacterium]MBD8205841.1 hypothetical protein [Microbacterium sp. CFBP 8801]MBD8476724.1 hypothetical protein [Microbacterium sp. CFBP 8794]MBD8509415.1 hypothetical protein [Microbacterium sp. CFBP 8790]